MAGIDGKVIAITGIGRAAALLLAGRGATVVLGARRIDELEAVVREVRAEHVGCTAWRGPAVSPVFSARTVRSRMSPIARTSN